MSAKRGRGDNAPSLFPFLAVLLCTVGALILMLVLIVGRSQAAVKEAVDNREQRVEELKSKVETVREAFREDREKIQLEIEKKRMSLEALERQTVELVKELEHLDKTSEIIDQQLTEDDSVEKVETALSEMQQQLAEAAEKLKDKLAKPSNEKPVFAIIPYEGNNGTHRRPIYLECRADGIMIQPEGVFIPLKDLKPPYGPGNPLDAALRTVRNHYSPQGALNSSAYPLLVVRSSGIRTYALARMAMSGWDDQFGYELIEDTMELAYPEGEKSLVKELDRALVTARNRQAALVVAMPGRYRQAMEELNEDNLNFEDGEGSWGSGEGDLASSGMGSGAGFGDGTGDGAGGGAGFGSGEETTGGSIGASGGRGGFAFTPDGASGAGAGSLGSDSLGNGSLGGGSGMRPGSGGLGMGGSGLQGFATGGETQAGDPNAGGNAPFGTGSDGSFANGQNGFQAGGGGAAGEGTTFGQAALGGNQYTRGRGDPSATGQGSGEAGGQMAPTNSSSAGKAASGNAAAGKGGAGQGNFRDALNAARSKQTGTGDAQGTVAGSSVEGGNGGSQMAGATSEGFGTASGSPVSGSPGQAGAEMGSPMADLSINKKDPKKDAESVAKRKGRNWAWTNGPAKETAVVRNIRVAVYEDRWVIMPDVGSKDRPTTIMLDRSLQASAEDLAKVVADRMDRWGYALAGGYWKPVLQVEVAPRGEVRYKQLTRLLDGSGLEINVTQSATPAGTPASK